MSDDREDDRVDSGSAQNLGRMVVRGSVWLLLARVVRALCSLIGLAILARLLEPADFGVLVMALTLPFLGSVILSGLLDAPLTRHLDLTGEDLRGLLWLALTLMAALGAVLWIAAPSLEAAMRFPRLTLGIRASVPVMVLQTYMIAGIAVLRRTHHFRTVAALSVLNIVFYLVPAITLAALGYGLWSVLGGQIVAAAVTALQFVRRANLPLLPPWRLSLGTVGHTGWYGVGSKLCEFAATSVDTLVVALYLGPAMTGIYSRAYNIGTQIKEPFVAVDSTIRQALAKMPDEQSYRREIDRILRLIMIATTMLVAGIIVARNDVTMILLGPKFMAAAPILVFILIALPARTLLLTLDGAMVARGKMRHALFRSAVSVAIMIPGVWIGVRYGAIGVAVAVAVAGWIGALFALLLFSRDNNRSYGSLLVLLVPGVILGLVSVAIGHEVDRWMDGLNTYIRLGAVIALFGCMSLAAGLILPTSWLPRIVAERRTRLLRAGRTDRPV